MSLITYPVAADPRAFTPRSVSLAQDVNARSFASPFGGSEQAVDMLNDRWRLSMELPPCTQPDAAKREAFINALRGQVNHTELHHFGRPYPQGTLASCQGLVYDAPQGADSITIATTAGATLLAGDMLGVDGLLLQCRADCTADANGLLVVPLTNRLRRAVPGLRRASTATYVDGSGLLQTAGVDVPRFQGGQLLVEGVATNLIANSQNFGAWAAGGISNMTVTTGVADPFGGTAAARLTSTSASNLFQQAVGVTAGVTLTGSFWIRRHTGSGAVNFRVGDGTAYPVSVTSNWQRLPITAAATTTTGRIGVVLSVSGDAVEIFGAQLEAGAAMTSYIPTTTAPVTRAADIITPVVWQKPTAPFRLVGRPALRYVPGYSESLALDFVEKVD